MNGVGYLRSVNLVQFIQFSSRTIPALVCRRLVPGSQTLKFIIQILAKLESCDTAYVLNVAKRDLCSRLKVCVSLVNLDDKFRRETQDPG